MKNLIKITAIIFAFAMLAVACDKKQNEVNPIENNIEPNHSGVIKAPAPPPTPPSTGTLVWLVGKQPYCDYDIPGDCCLEFEIVATECLRGLMTKLDDIIINNPSAISDFFKENDDWKTIFPQLEVSYPQYVDLLKSGFLTMKRCEGANGIIYYMIYSQLVSVNNSNPKCLAVFPIKMIN